MINAHRNSQFKIEKVFLTFSILQEYLFRFFFHNFKLFNQNSENQ